VREYIKSDVVILMMIWDKDLRQIVEKGRREKQFREFIEESKVRKMGPEEILRRISEIQPLELGQLQPVVGEGELKATAHEHFMPVTSMNSKGQLILDSKKTTAALKKMWGRVRKKGLHAAAILSHSYIDRTVLVNGEEQQITPEWIYNMVEGSMPEDVRASGFQLIPATEFKIEGTEMVVLGTDRQSLFGNERLWSAESIEEIARVVSEDQKLVAFFPHPYSPEGGAAHDKNLGVDETARIMDEYGVGVEFSGAFRDVEAACKVIMDKAVIPAVGKTKAGAKLRDAREMVARIDAVPLLGENAPFRTSGGDYHLPEEHLGDTFFTVSVRKKPFGLLLDQSYTIEQRELGLVVLHASGEAKTRAYEEPVAQAIEHGDSKVSLPEPSLGKAILRMSREYLIGQRKKEHPLIK